MALHRRSPRNLATALGPLTAAMSPNTLLAEVQAAWPTAVGELVAREASPVSERGGTLTVRCSAAVWAQELALMSEEIVARLNTTVSRGPVRDLRWIVGGS